MNQKIPFTVDGKGTRNGWGRDRSEQESQTQGTYTHQTFCDDKKASSCSRSLAFPTKPTWRPDLPWMPATRKQTEYYQSFSHWTKTFCLINLLIGFLDIARTASDVMRG